MIGRQNFLFFKNWCINFIKKYLFFLAFLWSNSMSTINKCPILSAQILSLLEVFSLFLNYLLEVAILDIFISFLNFCPHPLVLENVFFPLIFYFVNGLEIFFVLRLRIFWQQNNGVKGHPCIPAAKSNDQRFFKQLSNFGLCWKRDNCS